MATGTVWLRLALVQLTYDINQMDRTLRNIKQERERAELKLAGLRSPKRLEQIARQKFSLGQPKADQLVYLK